MSSINRCGTCRFWRGVDALDSWSWNLRPCGAVLQREDVPVVKDADGLDVMDDDGNKTPVVMPKAMAVDGAGYYAALKTAEDFGCVLWEPKS